MFEEQRQSSKLLKSGSFDACKNAVALIIAMLSHSELNIEVSDTGMESVDINSMLAVTQEGARFFCKNR